jgi:hypothetical protein
MKKRVAYQRPVQFLRVARLTRLATLCALLSLKEAIQMRIGQQENAQLRQHPREFFLLLIRLKVAVVFVLATAQSQFANTIFVALAR